MIVTHYGFNERADLTKARQFNTEQEVEDFLKLKFCGGSCFGTDNLLKSGQYREMAINYDFRPWLTNYLVKFNFTGGLQSMWAPNKTALRRSAHLSRNDKILLYPEACFL
jgi:hypothetical protein